MVELGIVIDEDGLFFYRFISNVLSIYGIGLMIV